MTDKLIDACSHGDIEAARLLVEKGADIDAKDSKSAATIVCFW